MSGFALPRGCGMRWNFAPSIGENGRRVETTWSYTGFPMRWGSIDWD